MASNQGRLSYLEAFQIQSIEGRGKFSIFSSLPVGSKHFSTLDRDKTREGLSSRLASDDLNEGTITGLKLKRLELSINEQVELSTQAAHNNQLDLALIKAKESIEQFTTLKSQLMIYLGQQQQQQQQLDASENAGDQSKFSSRIRQPMTTEVNLLELEIMVTTNLAERLYQSSRFQESLELYTRLCKLASGIMHSTNVQRATSIGSSTQSSSQDYRFLLYRFGINLGNVYNRMGDHQRALKYYRLTLDRMSSSGFKHLTLKLSYNIALTLWKLKQKREASAGLSRLLASNLNKQIQQNSNLALDSSSQGSSQFLRPFNSQHHDKFGLSLMSMLYELEDLTSMLSTLKQLVRVDINQYYDRVIATISNGHHNNRDQSSYLYSSALDTFEEFVSIRKISNQNNNNNDNKDSYVYQSSKSSKLTSNLTKPYDTNERKGKMFRVQDESESTEGSQVGISTSAIGATRDLIESNRSNNNLNLNQSDAIDVESRPSIGGQFVDIKSNHQSRFKSLAMDAGEKYRSVLSYISEDKLESLIVERHERVSNALLRSFNLLLHLTASKSVEQTFVLDSCLRLLQAGDSLYKNLTNDLRLEHANSLLRRGRNKLNRVVTIYRDVGEKQKAQYQASLDDNKDNKIKGSSKRVESSTNVELFESSMVLNNMSIICMLGGQLQIATKLAEKSLRLRNINDNGSNYANLANCHIMIENYQLAEKIYLKAQRIAPNNWLINYNLALLQSQHLCRHFDELNAQTRLILMKDKESDSEFRCFNLGLMQLANIYYKSPKEEDKLAALAILLNESSKVSTNRVISLNVRSLTSQNNSTPLGPEALLRASEILDPGNEQGDRKDRALNILLRAYNENPFHSKIAERLIALSIKNFNYKFAKEILAELIDNRPNEVKWYQILAECHIKTAEYKDAMSIYKKIILLFPNQIKSLRALVKLTRELGLEEELKHYQMRLEKMVQQMQTLDSRV